MLTNLQISNIVLIERLNLGFARGLNILTGETGAGKSILMDALALALGARSDVGLVRHGCDSANVVATFDEVSPELQKTLCDSGIDCEDVLILRRTLSADGKSRAWINDTPVSVKVLKQVGDMLVEIHGQFANHTLLNQSTHRATLDMFAMTCQSDFATVLCDVQNAYNQYRAANKRLLELQDMLAQSVNERDFLEHNIAELRALNPVPGEEEDLAAKRTLMMNAEKDVAILSEATDVLAPRGQSLDSQLFAAAHVLERIKTTPNPYQSHIDKLYDIAAIVGDIADALSPSDIDVDNLDAIEERLFAIRAAARKHRVTADELCNKLEQMETQLNAIDNSDAELKKATRIVNEKRAEFDRLSKILTQMRLDASSMLRTRVLQELPDLKLGQADFMIERYESAPCSFGCDDITFMIKTNPGTPFAPLNRAASGGELARLMLALRVVLSNNDTAHTFVFDEIDTGISGATASAVGQRLNRLASQSQALVITHSAQVAGYADKHFKIEKHSSGDITKTDVYEITGDERLNEIARIISGAEITPESLTMARTLIHA